MLRGYFADVNDKRYRVDIVKNGDTSDVIEVDLGEEPFITEMDSDGDTIYKNAKYQGATVTIVDNKYYWWLYAKTVHQNKVTLYEDDTDKVVWVGYVTPNIYNNSWEFGGSLNDEPAMNGEMEIECIDGLASLEYIKYKPEGGYNNKKVRTFVHIIDNILQKCECYKNFYFSTNTQIAYNNVNPIITKLIISECNFFSEKDDEDETDKDVAWSCKDVLQEICKYMGVTVVAFGEDVYFIDYDAIRAGINTYHKFEIGGDLSKWTKEKKASNVSISYTTYADNGQDVSMDEIYNKVTIKAELNDFDSAIPDFFDGAVNITSSQDTALSSSSNINNGMYGEVVGNTIGNTGGDDNKNMICMIDRIYEPQDDCYTDYYAVFAKYFNNPAYKFYKYEWRGNALVDVTDEYTELNYTQTKASFHGATLAKFSVQKLSNVPNWFELLLASILGGNTSLDTWLANNDVTNVDLKEYILMVNPKDHHITNEEMQNYPFFETVVTDGTALFGGDNAYLVISGSYIYHSFPNDPYPFEGTDISEGRYAMDAEYIYILCKLEFNGQYWNGLTWQAAPCTFQLPYMTSEDIADQKKRKADATMFKELPIRSTVSWRIGTSDKGYAIKLPNTEVIAGTPKLTVYKPVDPNYHSTKSGDNKGRHYPHYVVLLKDFSVKAIIGDPTFSGKNETDTKYTNIINDTYVNEMDDINFKINTWDNKKPNFSSVGYKNTMDKTEYLDKTYNAALNAEE